MTTPTPDDPRRGEPGPTASWPCPPQPDARADPQPDRWAAPHADRPDPYAAHPQAPAPSGDPRQPAWPAADPTRIGPAPGPPGAWGAPPGTPGWGAPPAPPAWGPSPASGPAGPWGQPAPGPPPGWNTQATGGPPPPWGQPAWGAPPPPPRRGRGTVVALVLVGALVLAGLGVGAFLLVRTTTTAGGGGSTPPAVALRDVTAAGLTFGVPSDWTPETSPGAGIAGLPVEGAHSGPGYECGGDTYLRGFVAALTVPGVPADLAAEQTAQLAGTAFYRPADGSPAQVQVADARPVDVGGAPAQLAEATVTVSDDGCLATGGTVLVLAVPVGESLSVLVVNGDTVGGPADAPPVPPRATLDAMIASARPAGI